MTCGGGGFDGLHVCGGAINGLVFGAEKRIECCWVLGVIED